MAVFTSTELNAVIPEVWDSIVEDARYAASVILPRVMNKSDLVKGKGDILHLSYQQTYSVGDVTAATGAFTPQTTTVQTQAVTVNQWKQVAIEVTDKDRYQSIWKPDSTFPKEAGLAFGQHYDAVLMDLDSNFTSNDVGDVDNPTVFDDQMLLASMLKVRDRDIPLNELSFFLPPIAFYKGILTKPEFRDADKSGLPKNALTTNLRFPLLGVPAYETTQANSAGVSNVSKVGLLAHKSAMAIALQKNKEIRSAEGTAAGKLSYIVVVASLYGLSAFRTDHAARLFIRAS